MPYEPDSHGQWWYVAKNYRTRAYPRSCATCGATFYARGCDGTRSCGKTCAQRGQRGANAGRWKGGRHIDRKGYVHVLVDPADVLVGAMRDKRGYVTEHRAVMARALGRVLHRRETVHHLNGDRADSRVDNLQLLHLPHGPGARLECAECGSKNILALERER